MTDLDHVELLLVGFSRPVVLDDVPEVVLTEVQQQPHFPAGQPCPSGQYRRAWRGGGVS